MPAKIGRCFALDPLTQRFSRKIKFSIPVATIVTGIRNSTMLALAQPECSSLRAPALSNDQSVNALITHSAPRQSRFLIYGSECEQEQDMIGRIDCDDVVKPNLQKRPEFGKHISDSAVVTGMAAS